MKKQRIIIGLIVAIVIIAGLGYVLRPKATVQFALAPGDMTVTINKKKQVIHHDESISLSPGTYSLTFTRDGFTSYDRSITVKNKDHLTVVVALTPQNDAAKKIITDDTASAAVVKQFESDRYDDIMGSLPLPGINYSLTACRSLKQPKSTTKVLCIITSSLTAKDAALRYLRQAGVNPDNHEILVGTDSIKTLSFTDSYTIEWYTILATQLPTIYITPTSASTTTQQLESVKQAALQDLTNQGYDLTKYAFHYANTYLSKYDTVQEEDTTVYALPPVSY